MAQKLVHRAAEGGEIPTALLHNFADVVLGRRAMELAGLVLIVGTSRSVVAGSERGVADEG